MSGGGTRSRSMVSLDRWLQPENLGCHQSIRWTYRSLAITNSTNGTSEQAAKENTGSQQLQGRGRSTLPAVAPIEKHCRHSTFIFQPLGRRTTKAKTCLAFFESLCYCLRWILLHHLRGYYVMRRMQPTSSNLHPPHRSSSLATWAPKGSFAHTQTRSYSCVSSDSSRVDRSSLGLWSRWQLSYVGVSSSLVVSSELFILDFRSQSVHRHRAPPSILTSPAVLTMQLQRNGRPRGTNAFILAASVQRHVHVRRSVGVMDAAPSFRQHDLCLISGTGECAGNLSRFKVLGR